MTPPRSCWAFFPSQQPADKFYAQSTLQFFESDTDAENHRKPLFSLLWMIYDTSEDLSSEVSNKVRQMEKGVIPQFTKNERDFLDEKPKLRGIHKALEWLKTNNAAIKQEIISLHNCEFTHQTMYNG